MSITNLPIFTRFALSLTLFTSLFTTALHAQDAGVARQTQTCAPGRSPTPVLDSIEYDNAPREWHVSETAAAVPASPAVATACAAQVRTADAARARVVHASAGSEMQAIVDSEITNSAALLGGCHHVPGGAWVLEAGSARIRTVRANGESTAYGEISFSLAFITATGTVLHARGGMISNDPRRKRTARWTTFHDFAHDGTTEAALAITEGLSPAGAPARTTSALWTITHNAIAPYAPAAALRNFSVPFDADRDGNPDFAQRSAFSARNTCGPDIFYGASELAHTLANGTFSLDDAVAREFLRMRCADFSAMPQNFMQDASGDRYSGEIPRRVSCWRHWGVSVAEISRLMQRDWPQDDDHCTSRTDVTRSLRTVTPRFRLEPPCTAAR